MKFSDVIFLSIRALKSNILRSVLTLLIIAIGITALITILTSIEAIKTKLTSDFVVLGANAFTIQRTDGLDNWKNKNSNPNISLENAIAFQERFIFPSTISFNTNVTSNAIVESKWKESNPNVKIVASDYNYLKVTGRSLYLGRSFSQLEVLNGSNVAIMGFDIAARTFENKDSVINSTISINSKPYQVIGMTASKGATAGSNDNFVLIPYKSAQKNFSISNKSFDIIVEASESEQLNWAINEAEGLFRSVRKLKIAEDNNFFIARSDKLAEMYISNMEVVKYVSIIIAFLTLIGAGVGLMNIMLVSVNERTREIGVTKSLGATKQAIFIQFLTEAVTICIIGGTLGIMAGIFLGNLVALILNAGFVLAVGWVIFGLFFCFTIGILAGLYPAIKASKLNPVEALRYE